MKLDEKYFDCKLIDLLNCFSFRKHLNPEPNDGYKPEFDILHQIARDAAEAQREKCVELLSEVSFSTGRSEDFMKGFLMALVFAKGKMLNAAGPGENE